jgi:hypothetical protein
MALTDIYGDKRVFIGPDPFHTPSSSPSVSTNVTLDAANESCMMIGHVVTSDGASHTIDTTGSSSIGWRTATVTFANGGTTVNVGVGDVIATAGPPGRANNAADVITFDVNASFTGGGGGITANAWQTSVPTTGTKTIANGDLVAVSIQMTARGGADSVLVTGVNTGVGPHRPAVTSFLASAYAAVGITPNAVITFSDGALGWISGGQVFSTLTTRTYNSGSSPNEYGQLIQLPFPAKIYGAYGWADPDGDFDVVLYSDPLGTPVPERTVSVDLNTAATGASRKWEVSFATPYQTTAALPIGIVAKPTTVTSMSISAKTLASATHRATDPWGTSGYGISRSGGAGVFANANSSLDHYFIGLLAGSFDSGGRVVPINATSLVS